MGIPRSACRLTPRRAAPQSCIGRMPGPGSPPCAPTAGAGSVRQAGRAQGAPQSRAAGEDGWSLRGDGMGGWARRCFQEECLSRSPEEAWHRETMMSQKIVHRSPARRPGAQVKTGFRGGFKACPGCRSPVRCVSAAPGQRHRAGDQRFRSGVQQACPSASSSAAAVPAATRRRSSGASLAPASCVSCGGSRKIGQSVPSMIRSAP